LDVESETRVILFAGLIGRGHEIKVQVNVMPRHDHGNILHQPLLDAVRWMKENK